VEVSPEAALPQYFILVPPRAVDKYSGSPPLASFEVSTYRRFSDVPGGLARQRQKPAIVDRRHDTLPQADLSGTIAAERGWTVVFQSRVVLQLPFKG
jgi:hypothetical protein